MPSGDEQCGGIPLEITEDLCLLDDVDVTHSDFYPEEDELDNSTERTAGGLYQTITIGAAARTMQGDCTMDGK